MSGFEWLFILVPVVLCFLVLWLNRKQRSERKRGGSPDGGYYIAGTAAGGAGMSHGGGDCSVSDSGGDCGGGDSGGGGSE